VQVEPFTISVDDGVFDDLRERIARTRWAPEVPGIGWKQGTDAAYVRSLLAYWADGFDWPAQERALNRHDHFRAQIEGTWIHFVHARAASGEGIPLILTHGWPSTFIEYLRVLPLLTDPAAHGLPGPGFDVVIPSLPGYGWSERPPQTGVDYRFTARLWHQLMRGLGYEGYGAAGGDFGAGITTYMALDDPDPLLGIYVTTPEIGPYIGPGSRPLSSDERGYLEKFQQWRSEEWGYLEIQATKPQSLGFGLNDSPAGLAAWIVEKWRSWGDTHGDVDGHFTRDLLLTNITIYWVTQTITSSMRDYYDDRGHFIGDPAAVVGSDDRVEVPTAFAQWPRGLGVAPDGREYDAVPPREWIERLYNVVRWSDMPAGGHFSAVEEPERYAADITAFFETLSST
jgi:pimeloyl-ACP methyl ester carboxylesterase